MAIWNSPELNILLYVMLPSLARFILILGSSLKSKFKTFQLVDRMIFLNKCHFTIVKFFDEGACNDFV